MTTPIKLLDDPEFKQFIENCNKLEAEISFLPLSVQRKRHAEFLLSHTNCNENVHRIINQKISGLEEYEIPLRIYIPNENPYLPVIMYFHGGGWVFGSIEQSDAVCRRLANHLECIIVSVEYRLAPENPFPKPLEDCYVAMKWVAEKASLFGGNNKNLMVCGESAGGNLAAAVALMSRDRQEFKLTAQLLLYPVISSNLRDDIYKNCPDQYFLTKEAMKFFWDKYTHQSAGNKNPYASLDCNTNFNDLPPALIVTAEYDPLSFEALRYGDLLIQSGVQVVKKSFLKLIHGFLYIPLYSENNKVLWTKELRESLKKLKNS